MSYAQSIDGLNIEVTTGKLAQSIDSLDMLLSTSEGAVQDGIVLLSPANGEINVSVTPSFDWSSSEVYDAYKILIDADESFSSPIEAYVTVSDYAQTTALLSATGYFWKVIGGDVVDKPVIVPDDGFTGMTVWDANTDPAPIYVPNDIYVNEPNAPDGIAPLILDAANDLADYIAQSSGKTRPEVIQQASSQSTPQRCIKIGYPNNLTEPEQTMIKCSANGPIELTGVDVFNLDIPHWENKETDLNYMSEAGTYHSVMTFLQDYIGVVWGFIGHLGEAVPSKAELKVSTIEKTHVPSCSIRQIFHFSVAGEKSPFGISKSWLKRQRGFYSLPNMGGHPFKGFYDTYHPNGDPGGSEAHLFALQPDGTRSGWPETPNDFKGYAKVERGEPLLIDKWYTDVVQANDQPLRKGFSTAIGDYHTAGHSVDPRAKAMDYPPQGFIASISGRTISDPDKEFTVGDHENDTIDIFEILPNGTVSDTPTETKTVASNTADSVTVDSDFTGDYSSGFFYYIRKPDVETVDLIWQSGAKNIPSLADREMAFAKKCLERLNQENEDGLVFTSAYGPAIPGPKRETNSDPRLFIDNVSNSFTNSQYEYQTGKTFKEHLDDWVAVCDNVVWGPNVGYGYGNQIGCWFAKPKEIGARFKELISQGLAGFSWGNFEHYAPSWPMWYVMSQLLWDHTQNVEDLLNKAYTTLFGNASEHIKDYYERIELQVTTNFQHGASPRDIHEVWDSATRATLSDHLETALGSVPPDSVEHERVRWVKAGHDWAQSAVQACIYHTQYNSPAVAIPGTPNLATNANAVESNVNGIVGWSGNVTPVVQSDGDDFVWFFESDASLPEWERGDALDGNGRVEEGTASGGSTTYLDDSTKSWTVDEFAGMIVRIVGGTADKRFAYVESNTATRLTFVEGIDISIASDSQYEVIDKMYLVEFTAKHGGQPDGRWGIRCINTDVSGQPNYALVFNGSVTEYRTFQLLAIGGQRLRIYRSDEGGTPTAHFKSITIREAKPVDRQAIADLWNLNNAAAIEKVNFGDSLDREQYPVDYIWEDSAPIGKRAWGLNVGLIPKPDGGDYDPLPPEFE